MVRFQMKGGVWKNTEDEILKVAVQKYGKNQWARISSLLVRKSAKQCKARWYEWLDPSIKKTEWSKEEEEKLLHLAKLFPGGQWRTIAPIVGRTAAQCLEHYEKLLDAATERGADYDARDDPRRLRPGEIDPQPETKPAKPDPVDMDDDEKEMLSEARARVSNIQGKKAKRKAREKLLEDARRLARVQKQRELRAAGIEMGTSRSAARVKKGEIDYNRELPFFKPVPAGFFDVGDERLRERDQAAAPRGGSSASSSSASAAAGAAGTLDAPLQALEGKRRTEVAKQRRKQDAERMKRKMAADMPAAVAEINRLLDPSQARKRSKLMLPLPQMSDQELAQIAKLTEAELEASALAAAGAGDVDRSTTGNDRDADGFRKPTSALLSSYTPATAGGGGGVTPLTGRPAAGLGGATPMRTPLGGASVGTDSSTVAPLMSHAERMRQAAQNLIVMRDQPTPLLGGENTPLHAGGGDFSGATPASHTVQTPNALVAALTPARRDFAGQTPAGAQTPVLRDALAINASAATVVDGGLGGGAAQVQAAAAAAASENRLRRNLASLPAPSRDYEVVVPAELEAAAAAGEQAARAADTERRLGEDAADRDARLRREMAQAEAASFDRSSSVLRRGLPRPRALPPLAADVLAAGSADGLARAEQALSGAGKIADLLVRRELAAMQCREHRRWPPVAAAPLSVVHRQFAAEALGPAGAVDDGEDSADGAALPEPSPEEVAAAAHLVDQELAAAVVPDGNENELLAARDSASTLFQFAPAKRRRAIGQSGTARRAALDAEFHAVDGATRLARERNAAQLQKLAVVHGGYARRLSKLAQRVRSARHDRQALTTEQAVFERMRQWERKAFETRHRHLLELCDAGMMRNRALQAQYKRLMSNKEALF